MRLTEHFTLEEFTQSSTATRLKINNTPPDNVVNNLKGLCEHVLEPLRTHFNAPITIGSGYRCPKLNKAVGGVSTSNHQSGCAADLHFAKTETGKAWFNWIVTNIKDFDECIFETADKKHYWLHVAYRPSNNRHKVVAYLLKK